MPSSRKKYENISVYCKRYCKICIDELLWMTHTSAQTKKVGTLAFMD